MERARTVPADSVLEELEGARFSGRRWSDQPGLVAFADKVLAGEVNIPGYDPTSIKIPFDRGDLEKGLPGWQLEMASLAVPEILLCAYEVTAREPYLLTARDIIVGWAREERSAWVPGGFLRDNHATVSRTVVLGHFWRLYRHHASYDPAIAREVLTFAVRGTRHLADPAHFIAASNQGVMQNLALWHAAIAFPWIPDRDSVRGVARRRLESQMKFYVDSQGVVLEHSAEYQAFGLELIGMALRYLTLMGEPLPSEWVHRYEGSLDVYARMRWPDDYLPHLGDTESRPLPHVPLVTEIDASGRAGPLHAVAWEPRSGNELYPHAGYAIWWDGDSRGGARRQTVVAWSRFAGHAHKHADEPSVLLWADGTPFWTSVGDWTYGVMGREEALSWSGSNAPHLVGEQADSDRNTRPMGYGESARLSVIDLERTGPEVFRARRQVIHRAPDLWVVLDGTDGYDGDRAATVWTTSPDVQVRPGPGEGAYRLVPPGASAELRATFQGSPGTTTNSFQGSYAPFAGWIVHRGAPTSTTSIVVDRDVRRSWAAAVWRLAPREDAAAPLARGTTPVQVQYQSPDDWTISFSPWMGGGTLKREGNRLTASGSREPLETVTFAPVSVDTVERASTERSFREFVPRYPRARDLIPERSLVTRFLIPVAIVLEVALLALWWFRVRVEIPLRIVVLTGWILAGVWLSRVYFVTG